MLFSISLADVIIMHNDEQRYPGGFMFTLNDILQGNEGTYHLHITNTPDSAYTFPAAHHDSRLLKPGDLFIAIKGERVDGHSFIPTVARAGAGAVLCAVPSGDVPPDFL